MPISTAEEFFSVLEKSNLLTPEQVAEARREATSGEDATAVARTLAKDGLITRWQAGQLLAGRSSFFLGKYRLIDLLGRGGMGSVFLAEHTVMNRRVALKVISKQIGEDPASVERFVGEARAIAALDHPNIVQAYSVDNEGPRYYIVMEFIDGVDLQRLVETEGPLDYERAVDYVRQAADGLAHAHQHNMVHCDIKPSNLLVNNQGTVKILDMGLARLVGHQPDQPAAQEDAVLGSVDYLAPEQAMASCDFDHRADIYSLGCTLYYLLTGHPPFPEGSLTERIIKHQTQQPQGIVEQRSDAPAELVQICERMMAKRPEDRFQSAEEISRVLAEWRPPVRPPQPPEPPKKKEPPRPPKQPWLADELGSGAASLLDVADAAPTAGTIPSPAAAPAKHGLLETDQRKILVIGAFAIGAVVVLGAATIFFVARPGQRPGGANPSAISKAEPPSAASSPKDKSSGPPKPGAGPDETVAPQPPPDEPTPEPQPKPKGKGKGKGKGKKKPAEETPPEKPVEEPKTEEPKTEPAVVKPPQKKGKAGPLQQAKVRAGPLRELPNAIDLPALPAKAEPGGQASEPLALGPIHPTPGAPLDSLKLELLGGKDALKGGQMFHLRRDEAAGGGWQIGVAAEGAPADDPALDLDVAKLWLDGNVLKFAWSEMQAADRTRANSLRNCGMQVSLDKVSRFVAFSKPKLVEPITLDFDGGPQKVSLVLDSNPDPKMLRLQIIELAGNVPKLGVKTLKRHFEPESKTIEALEKGDLLKGPKNQPLKGLMRILFAVEGEDPTIELRIGFSVTGRAARIDVVPLVLQTVDGNKQWIPFDGKKIAARKESLEKMEGSVKPGKGRRGAAISRDEAQELVKNIKSTIEQLDSYGKFFQSLRNDVKLNFRVFTMLNETEKVHLYTTTTQSSGKKPAANAASTQ